MTMRPWILTGAAAAVAYGAALIALAPASVADLGLSRASDGRLRLAAPAGSLWAGRGQLELRDPDTGSAIGRAVEWRLEPGRLRDGGIGFEVRAHGVAEPFSVIFSWRRVEMTGARMSLPAGALGLALPQLAPLELTGNVALDVPAVVWEKGEVSGGAAVRWSAAGSTLSKVSPLGSYELKLECSRSIARLALTTIEGALELTGSGAWTLGHRPRLRASARVAPSHRRELAPLLGLVGVEREPGRFELELK